MTPDYEELLTLAETIKALGISKQTLYRLLERGALKGVKVGRQWRFRQEDLDIYLGRSPAAQAVTTAQADVIEEELDFIYRQLDLPVPALPGELDSADEKIILLINGLFAVAIAQGASDIHLEPARETGLARIRIDGVLHELRRLPIDVFRGVIIRLKTMADMNLEVNWMTQDGRIHIRQQEKDFDLRISVLPTVFGESAVIRLLSQGSVLLGLEKLGFYPDDLARLERWCGKPNGLIIATGPTGSGKTTTLYSCLLHCNTGRSKILTIEDPVEYILPGTVQTAVNMRNGFTFPVALRSILRADPDIVLVGEVRDRETLEIAIQVALTGHLVFTTLHTQDAANALTRMVDIGAESFLVASCTAGILAQRLIRKLCPQCKEAATLSPVALAEVTARAKAGGFTVPKDAVFYRAVGCAQCAHRGFRGRTGIFELLEFSPAVRDAFLSKAPKAELVDIAVREGMHTLLADGIRKAAEGLTTIEEVLRVTA